MSGRRDGQSQKTVWYQAGLQFSCAPGCRRCCGGAPGDVWVTEEEIRAIAQYKRVPLEEFEAQYIRRYGSGRASLIEKPNLDCILLDEHGCSVYPVRPKQCRDYPFWPEVTQSASAWRREKVHCPGIGEGALHSCDKIRQILASQTEEDSLDDSGKGA